MGGAGPPPPSSGWTPLPAPLASASSPLPSPSLSSLGPLLCVSVCPSLPLLVRTPGLVEGPLHSRVTIFIASDFQIRPASQVPKIQLDQTSNPTSRESHPPLLGFLSLLRKRSSPTSGPCEAMKTAMIVRWWGVEVCFPQPHHHQEQPRGSLGGPHHVRVLPSPRSGCAPRWEGWAASRHPPWGCCSRREQAGWHGTL